MRRRTRELTKNGGVFIVRLHTDFGHPVEIFVNDASARSEDEGSSGPLVLWTILCRLETDSGRGVGEKRWISVIQFLGAAKDTVRHLTGPGSNASAYLSAHSVAVLSWHTKKRIA